MDNVPSLASGQLARHSTAVSGFPGGLGSAVANV